MIDWDYTPILAIIMHLLLLSLCMEIRQFFITKTWWGKLIGAFFGFLVAGPVGCLLGLIVGNFFDRGLAEHFSKPFWFYHHEKDKRVQQVFFESTFLLFGYIAKSEGRVSEQSIFAAQEVMKQMQLNHGMQQKAQDYFKLGKQKNFNLEITLYELYQTISQRPPLTRLFLETQYQYIRHTGLTENKLRIMNALLTQFHLAPVYEQPKTSEDYFNWSSQNRHYQQHESHSRQSPHSPTNRMDNLSAAYQLLGLTSAATQSEVKKAYRRLISANHPDKLIAKNASEQAIKHANIKTQQIRRAYEQICEVKGW